MVLRRMVRVLVVLATIEGMRAAQGGTFLPASVTDHTPTEPLQSPNPTNYQPRYISGFGSNNDFTVVFEDRDAGQAISFVHTSSGISGFPASVTSCGITDTHFCVKAWPITIDTTNYDYRGWGSVGNNPQHHFYVGKSLTEWHLVSTFTISNAAGFNPGEFVYYGFHDVLLINGTYYAWGEGNGGGTLVVRSPTGKDDWEAFARVGGNDAGDGPLWMLESPTPSGSFVDLGYNRGLGKIQVRGNDSGYYLAVNTACRANLSPAEYEAAFTNVANWTWNNGTTGAVTNTTALLTATAEHDCRECWMVPNSDPDAAWVIIYDADYGAGDGGKALGYATLAPPGPGPVHNLTQDTYHDTIQEAVDEADPYDVISVATGTYTAVDRALAIIDIPLTLVGETNDGGRAVLEGDAYGSGQDTNGPGNAWPRAIVVQTNDVTLRDFTIADFQGDQVTVGGYAIVARADASWGVTNTIEDLTVENVTFEDCHYGFRAQNVSSALVQNCRYATNDGVAAYAVYVNDSADTTIRANLFSNGCIWITDASDAVIGGTNAADGNVVVDAVYNAIWLGQQFAAGTSSDGLIQNNVVNGAEEGGIVVWNGAGELADGLRILDNAVTGTRSTSDYHGGISIWEGIFSNLVIQGNVSTGNVKSGLSFNSTVLGSGTVTSNLFSGDADGGILFNGVTRGTDIHVNANSIYGNTTGITIVAGSGPDLDAVSNWWGSYAGPGATDGGGRTGDTASTNVTWDPVTLGEYGANFDGDGFDDDAVDPDDDNDGATDANEVAAGTDPLDAASFPPVQNVTRDWYYATIQAAVDEADEGDLIHIQPGVYSGFTIDKQLIIEGSGNTDNPAVSTIVTGVPPTIKITAGGSSETNRLEVRNLRTTLGTGTPSHQNSGIWIYGSTDMGYITISNVVSTGNAGSGASIDHTSSIHDLLFVDCDLSSNGWMGLRFPTSSAASNIVVDGCTFAGNTRAGLLSYSVAGLAIRNSTFSGNAAGVDSEGEIVLTSFLKDVEFSNLSFTGNGADVGIRVSGTSGYLPAGAMTFSNLTFQGTYTHAAIQLSRYTNATAVSFADVDVLTTSPIGLHLGSMYGEIDVGGVTFNGTHSKGDVALGRHDDGYGGTPDDPKAQIAVDASGATFTGAGSNWDIEDRVFHGPDDADLGTAAWVAGAVFVTPDSGSVGRGAEACPPGGTVTVAVGTYTEHVQGVISHSMTIRSEGGDCGSGVEVTGTNGVFYIADGASDVTIQGCVFRDVGGQPVIEAAPPVTAQHNITIISNCFHDIEYAAIDAYSTAGANHRTNWLVAANLVDGVTDYPNSGFRFYVLENSRILGNTIQDVAYNGINAEAFVDVAISGNLISNVYGCGIQLANSSAGGGSTPFYTTNVTIAGNTILNANTNGSSDKGAITVYHPDIGSAMIVSNLLTGNNNGFAIREKTNALSAGIHVNYNSIYGNNGYGAGHFGTGGGTLDAENNWWGSYAGAGATDGGGRTGDAVTAAVDYDPWTYGAYGANYDGDALEDAYDPDDDNDGFSDVEEVAEGTDPLDPGSFPTAQIAGTIFYSGSQTGVIEVCAILSNGFHRTRIAAPGPYVITNLRVMVDYTIWAYRDSNGNNTAEVWEASGAYSNNPITLTGDISGIDVTLEDDTVTDSDTDGLADYDEVYTYGTDPDDPNTDGDSTWDGDELDAGTDPLDPASFPASIAGDVVYAGSQTGTIYLAVSNATLLRTQQLADPGAYVFTNLPTLSNYWISAYRDSNGNGTQDTWEASGRYLGDPLNLTTNTAGINVSLEDDVTADTDGDHLTDYDEVYTHGTDPYDPDTDDDLMPDGWEVDHSLNPLVDDADLDPDTDELVNLLEYQNNADPQDDDSDDDTFEDGAEVFNIGSDPANPDDPVVVDDDGPDDPLPGDPALSDPAEDGSAVHPFDAIQEGVDEATNGMVVLVLDGYYTSTGNRDIRPGGKAIAIRSRNGSAATVIEDFWRGFICDSGETTNTAIEGFAIHMWSSFFGEEGLLCDGTSPRLVDCRVWDSQLGILVTNGGAPRVEACAFENCPSGGAGVFSSDPRFDRTRFVSNTAARGAGVLVEGTSRVTMVNCLVADNQSSDEGGGVYLAAGSLLTNINCTLAGNTAAVRGGGFSSQSSAVHFFRNGIVFGNTAPASPGFYNTAAISFQYCCLQQFYPGLGNTTNNPLFGATGDYQLLFGSPAIDSGSPAYDPGIDLLGVVRPLDGDLGAGPRVDMGAYETMYPPFVDITNSDAVVAGTVTNFTIGGTNNAWVIGLMWWTNALTGSNGTLAASSPWTIADIDLAWGENLVAVYGTNEIGAVATDRVSIIRNTIHGGSPVHYAATNGGAIWPYTNWAMAARNIQDAVNAADTNETVLVSNGVYDADGYVLPGGLLTNRVGVVRPMTVRSMNGPDVTTIEGRHALGGGTGPDAVRCAYLCTNTLLDGFTLTDGATTSMGGDDGDGGGAFALGAVLTNCVISHCDAHLLGGGTVGGTLHNCLLHHNYGMFGGGAIDAILYDCVLHGNGAQNGAGGNQCDMYNCLVFYNGSTAAGGGALGGHIVNSTLCYNQTGGGGGGGANCSEILNSILYYNTPDNCIDSTNNYTCTTPMPATGIGNVTNEPLFVDCLMTNYHLLYGSPCIDGGTNLPGLPYDLDGTARPLDGDFDGTNTFDMGCYEYNPATADSNGDGIPDWWYHKHGLDPTNPATTHGNPDDDPFDNEEEWFADTIPTNGESHLHLTAVRRTNTFIAVSFPCSTARVYSLERGGGIVDGQWSVLAGQTNIPGDASGTGTLTDTNAVPPRLYRVGVALPP